MLRRDKAPRRRGRGPRRAAFGLAQPFFHGIAGGERGRNPAFWAPARLCAVFLRLCKGRCGKVPHTRTPTHRARLLLGRIDDGLGLFGSATGEWPVLFENGRVAGTFRKRASGRYFSNRQGCGSFGPTATEEAVCAARPHPRSSAGSSSNLLTFRSGMPAYGRIGRQLLPHGGSDVRHVFIRAGWAQPSGRGQILLLQGSVLAFHRGRLLLFAEDGSCFSPKNRYHIDIAKVRGAKAAFSTSGIERFRRRPPNVSGVGL